MPARSCAPAKGANFTPAKLTSLLTPSRRSPLHGLLLCGGWTLSGPYERRPGATPTYRSPSINSPSVLTPNHEYQGRAGCDVLHRHHLPVRRA
jgi:hypothetical protein